MTRCLIIFAREPKPGQVKSRLAKAISQEWALGFYKAFLKDTFRLAQKVRCDQKILAYASREGCSYLKKMGAGFYFHRQQGQTLGERMSEAVYFCEKRFVSTQTVIIGTDSPHLPVNFVQQAFVALKTADVVLGPCEDGGFYLLGVKRMNAEIFKDVVWSSSAVLDKTVMNAKRLGLRTELLDSFFDIDTSEDLEKLKRFLQYRQGTALATQNIFQQNRNIFFPDNH